MARYSNSQEGTEQRFCKERVHPEGRRLINTSLCAIFHKKGYTPLFVLLTHGSTFKTAVNAPHSLLF